MTTKQEALAWADGIDEEDGPDCCHAKKYSPVLASALRAKAEEKGKSFHPCGKCEISFDFCRCDPTSQASVVLYTRGCRPRGVNEHKRSF